MVETGATNSYVDYLINYYNNSAVQNLAHNGWTAAGLVNELTNIARDTRFEATNPNYENVSAVIINIGTNGGVSGTIENSIPQISNATNLNDELLNYLNITDVLENGIKYNGNIIDNANDYWDLFSNDWYGNVALCIEYIQWKNPKTQIFLLPPCISSIADNKSNSAKSIQTAMENLSEIYSINVIDINKSVGINRRNEELYRLDYVHGTNLRNEMVGNFIARYISNKIY